MGLTTWAKQTSRTLGLGFVFRRLLRQQERVADALEQQNVILNGIGRLLAKAVGEPWGDKIPRVSDEQFEDQSSVGAPDDQFFADLEAIREDYEERFGRVPTDREVLGVLDDHQRAREGTVEP